MEGDGTFSEISLDMLPAEILLHICSFLDAKTVCQTLSCVCTTLYDLLSSNTFWKIRIAKRWPQKYPAVPVNDAEFDWRSACVAREETHRLWSQHQDTMDHYMFTGGIFAPVDSVHLMKNGSLLAAGSRDRYLNLLDLTKLESGNPESVKNANVFAKMNAHKGWIWSITSLEDTLATASWDTFIHFWDLAAGCQLQHSVKCKSAILCTHFEPGTFLAGGYDRKVYHIDPRSPGGIVAEKRYHRKPVLCMAVDDKYCITGSEDSTVVVYDRRAGQVYKTISFEKYPMSLSYGHDQLWVGDKTGSLHLIDATDGDFDLVQSYESWQGSSNITGIVHGRGSLMTCSTNGTIQVAHPTLPPTKITTLEPNAADVADICYQNDVLACACSKVAVGIWKPKEKTS